MLDPERGDRVTAGHKSKLGEESGERAVGRALGVLVGSSSVSQQGVPGQPRGHKPCPGGHQTGQHSWAERGSSTVLSAGAASAGMLAAVWSLTI